jgi:hypothetical protein
MRAWLGRIAIVSTLVLASLPTSSVHAQSCASLPVVGKSGVEVQKEVSPPSTGITRSNWNTDFNVPANPSFRQYVARVVSKESGEYEIHMYLKYDRGADEVFSQTVQMRAGEPLTITGLPRTNEDPYQVNLEIGGLIAIGKSYTASVAGCN